jgi:gamma-glutamylcyclotransferase (GGCT)/AIG2-like uncharacterized protein YtfP
MKLGETPKNVSRARVGRRWAVFCYGTLARRRAHAVVGELFLDRHGCAAARFPWGDEGGLVYGSVLLVSDAELEELDRREGVPVVYDRVLVQTTDGIVAWAYEFQGEVHGLQELPDGRWSWGYLKTWRERYRGQAPKEVERRLSTKVLTLDP